MTTNKHSGCRVSVLINADFGTTNFIPPLYFINYACTDFKY